MMINIFSLSNNEECDKSTTFLLFQTFAFCECRYSMFQLCKSAILVGCKIANLFEKVRPVSPSTLSLEDVHQNMDDTARWVLIDLVIYIGAVNLLPSEFIFNFFVSYFFVCHSTVSFVLEENDLLSLSSYQEPRQLF